MSVDRAEFDPRRLFKEATLAARGICKERFEAFWCAGQAGKIKPLPLEKMAQKYAAQPRAAVAA
jgi:fructose-bisphosphate aldolase class II